MKQHRSQAWRVLALVSAINFVNAGFPPYVGSAMGPMMATDLALDRRMLGLMFSVFLLMTGLWGPLVALAIKRWGVRWTMAAGSALICAGASLMALAVTSGWGAIFAYGVLIGGGAGVGGMLVSQTVVTRWFVERRSLALSLVISAMALGGVAATLWVSWLALNTTFGWRAGFGLLAVLAAGTTALTLAGIKEWPTAAAEAPGAEPSPTAASHASGWTVGTIVRTGSFWSIVAGAVGMSAALSFVTAHGPIYLRDGGFSQAEISTWLALLTAGQLAGTLGTGALGDRISPRLLWAGNLMLLGASVLWLQQPGNDAQMLATGAIVGLGIGGCMSGVMSIPAHYYGALVYPAIIGIVTPILTVSGAVVSYASGAAFDVTGSYSASFRWLFALIAVSAFLLLVLKPSKKPGSA